MFPTFDYLPYIPDIPLAKQEDVVIVGRIFSDIDVEAEKLTEGSMFLESSRILSGGARTALKFDPALVIRNNIRGARGLGFFSGAIVALKGKNGGGSYFLVKEVLTVGRSFY
jgi:DNA polymerase alpha subunit B